MKKYDFVIVGAGIIGTSLARELALRKAGRIAVLEKEHAVGQHASGRNSGVIHSGINQKPGTLKARFSLEGSRLLQDFCRTHRVPMQTCGTLVIGRTESELSALEKLLSLAKDCGVPQVRLLTSAELQSREPQVRAKAALLSDTGATVDAEALCQAMAQDASERGVDFFMRHPVTNIEGTKLITPAETFEAAHFINCAGLYADKIGHRCGIGKDYQIIPFRGDYWEIKNCDIRSMIYQPPDLRFPFLKVHMTRETDRRVLAGPTATLALGREAYEKNCCWPEVLEMATSLRFWKLMLRPEFIRLCFENVRVSFFQEYFLREIQSIVPSVRQDQMTPYRSGIRAQMVDNSGRFVEDLLVEDGPNSTHILNAVSPGMTCSLAFARYVLETHLKL